MAESSISELRKQERIIVVPEHVEAPMWHNAPATLIRDVNEQGIYQNFSRQNSTYYDGSEPRTESADLESQNSNSKALDTDTDVTQKAPSESAQTTSPVVETNLEGAAEDGGKSQDTVVEPAQEENVSESAQNIVSYVQTIQKSFSYFFTHTTFAQEAVNTPDDVSVPILVGNEAENVAREDTSIQDIPHTDFHDEISEELQAERVDDVIQSETVPGEVRDTFSDENHATTSSTTNDEHEPVYTPIVGDSLTLSGFDMPRLESGQFIRNMQLRVSVGALTHIDTDDSMPSLEVEFTLGEGVWKSAGTILLEDEISNALNGGYYLFALPKIRDSKDLENFEVRFTYVGAVEAIKNLYVDSAWLEIDTEIFDREVLKNRISADNLSHLKKSDIFTLLSTDTDFTKGEVPHFTMRYESQRNPAIRFMRELLGRKLIDVRSLGVTHANVGVMSITPDVQVAQDGLITVQFSDADREKMQPGEYEIEITVTEGGKLFTDTFNFQWGMLALNPDKAEYAVGETTHLSFGALTRNGNTLCDANLQLYIIDPEEYISEVSVTQSGKCLGNNVTEVPDYQASFSPTHAGTYTMYLERVDAEGNVLAHTSDTFLVAETHDVSITRVGPTRIFPPAPYPMTLTVAASSSFRGTVTERVPYTFEIFDTDASVREVGAYKELTWDIDIRAEETKSFSYSFDAPDLSPYLYTLGPAKIESVGKNAHLTLTEPASSSTPNSTNASTSDIAIPETSSQSSVIYEEHRAWQIASDATGNMLLFWDGTGGLPSGWTCVSCVSGDPFFQKFIMGSSTYNAATGTASHTPTASGSYLASSGSAVENFSGSTISVTAHTHSFTPTVASASNLPSYRQLKVIQYTASAGEPASIPTGAIGMFDGALPSGWTAYTAQNGYYIRGENTPGTTGGSNTHTHSVTGTSGTAGGSTVGNRGGGTQANGAPAGHTHTISTTTLSVSNEPPYREVVLAKLNATSSPQNDLITMWTDSVPTSWIDVSTNGSSAFSRKILKVASGYGATGGSVTHNHANISNIISSGSSGTLVSGRTGSAGSSFTHTHSVSVSNFSVSNNLPPTITVIIGKRQGDNPLFAQQSYRWYANTNAQTPTDPWPAGATNIVEAEPITATSTPLKFGDIARLRMNVSVANATATIASTSVKLQYASTTGTCASASVWNYVGSATSSAIWKGYNNSLVSDHGTLSTTTLATSTVLESYEENGYSALIPNQIRVGKVGEWDFVLQQNGAYPGATYCFRLVTANGSPFNSYITYPTLLTNRAPVSPTVSKLFDNEKIASTTPWFEFVSTDPESQDITYQIQIDNDYDFSSTVSDHNSASNGTLFENLITPSDKDPFTSGQLIRYKSNTTLTNGVTYWIRVRGKDPSGSNVWGDWSAARSFTIDTSLTVSAWHQTTREQFSTDTLSGVTAVISNQVQLISGSTTGSMVTSAIRFNDGSKGNAWDSLSWSDTETVGDIKYHIEYYNGSAWQQISDSVLSGNVTGFDTSPVSLLGLDTGTYGTIRIVADFTDSGGSPSLQDVTVSWGYRVSTPETPKPFANEKVGTTTPSFQFSASDPQGDSLTYQISWSTSNLFTSSTTRTSDAHAGFVNINQGGDLDPFNTGNSIRFTVQSSDTLTNNTTYWWRVRAKDPAGSNAWSLWSSAQSFTVDTTVIVSTWFQTTQQQFATNILSGTKALSSNVLAVATTASEAMVVYGEGVQTEPKYRTWDGSAWSSQGSLNSIAAPLRWAVVRAGTQREEYIAATIGTDADVNLQVYALGTWGNLQEVTTSVSDISARGVDAAYESTSGDAIVVYCDGDADPSYYVWNGTTWTSGGTINLASTNNCSWITLATDPTSDEMILMARDSVGTGAASYELQVWNGSSWGNSTTQGGSRDAMSETMSLLYEESGGQALSVSGDGNPARFEYNSWNGTAWAGLTTFTLPDNIMWSMIARDVGTDNMALCYVDESTDAGVVRWTGSSWTGQTTLDAAAKTSTDRSISCAYETTSGRDGNIMAVYSDTTNARYQVWNGTSWSAEASVSTITDASTIEVVRTGVGSILGLFFDDTNDRIDFSSWSGSAWSTAQTLSSNASVDTSPFGQPFMMAPRNSGKEGTVVTTPGISFTEGVGPYWDQMSWVDTTPGTSDILYSLQYYDTASSTWKFIPNSDLPGNIAGTSTSPINLSNLSKTTYSLIRPYARLVCDPSNNCPTISDWTVKWAQGITVSGTIKQYDQSASTTSGTVAVAVNGVLQTGKTGTISNGVWSISNVTTFPGDIVTVFVSGAANSAEAVGVTRYDGIGNITGLSLYERHLSLGSNDATSTPITNTDIGLYDNTNTEDLFNNVSGTTLSVCAESTCGDAELIIKQGTYYRPNGSVATHDFENNGTLLAGGSTLTLSGSWDNNATATLATSTVVLSATSTSEIIDTTGSVSNTFYNLTFGTTTGTATWTPQNNLDIDNNLTVAYGTLSRGGRNITVAGNLTNGASGYWSGIGTTTFDGASARTWSDANSTKQNVGRVAVDGTSKTITFGSNVRAQSVTIGADDILDASSSHYDITVLKSFINNNTFVARNGEVLMSATTTGNIIKAGSDTFYDLTFSGGGGAWSFTENTLSIQNNLTVATGTLTMPTATTTITGSFSSAGGTFAHNNGTVIFNGSGSKTVTVTGGPFTNAFYNLRFGGSGTYSFTDSHATTSNDFSITQGGVTFPSAYLTIGGSFAQTGGSFTHNSGTVKFTSASSETIDIQSSSFNSLSFNGTGSWSFLDSSITAFGSVWVANGTLTMPSGTLTVGGSYGNYASVTHNNGTILFNSTSGSETINFGGSSLYNVTLQSSGGVWDITQSATTTHNFTIATSSAFTLSSGQTLSVGNEFRNFVGGASTTWTGSTLSLEVGSYSVNTKNSGGDSYATLRVKSGAHIAQWNSDASAYAVTSGASLYSQDHAGVDGNLYIFGDYVRSLGNEYWSYATDFDGVDITGTPRQAHVRFEAGATAQIGGGYFEVVGTSSASTTVANQGSGTYTLSISSATTTFGHYEFKNLGSSGVSLMGTGHVASLSDGYVEPGIASGTGFTVASTTIDANQGLQIQRVNFSTTSAISATNVTQVGTASSYWWFRNSIGNIDGEAFDADSGDPGSIRWDDSSLVISISGTVYQSNETSTMGAPICDGVTQNIRAVVQGGSSYTGSCDSGNGTFSIGGVVVVGDPVVAIYLNTNGGKKGSVITKTPTADITNITLYENHVVTRHEDVVPLSIADMAVFDTDYDTDLMFSAATGTVPTLTVFKDTELHVASSTTFNPLGVVTVSANASSTSVDGSLHLDNGATFVGYATSTLTLGGSLVVDAGATFSAGSTTVHMNATTTGKTVTTPTNQEIIFNNLAFTGISGGWNINGNIRAIEDVAIDSGTVTGTGDITVVYGSLSGNGLLSLGSGTTTIMRTSTLGGTTPWTFGNLMLGNSFIVGTTTPAGATTTILGKLTIATGHVLDAQSSVWSLAGTGNVFAKPGTFKEGTSRVRYRGAGATNVLSTTYYNLDIVALGNSPTYTVTGLGTLVLGDLTVGGATTTTLNLNTHDPLLEVNGAVHIASTGIFQASDSAFLRVGGNWNNDGVFTANNGTTTFDGTGTQSIAAGSSWFGNVHINSTGDVTFTEHATTSQRFTLASSTSFTVSSGQSFAVGGAFLNRLGGSATTWTGATLFLYGGGNYTINAKSITDSYATLRIGGTTQVRMWNSDASTYDVGSNASLYSQDHANTNGLLNIYGAYTKTTGTDYWNYARDFDGVDISGSPRVAQVQIASGSSVTYLGGGISVLGSNGASTTVQNQGSGTFAFRIGGNASTTWSYYTLRDVDGSGLTLSGTPNVISLSRGDIQVSQNNGSGMTVGGTVITQNPAKTFTNNRFTTNGVAAPAYNVTATGTSISSWRFTNHSGALAGETYDTDPAGDPGYVVWDDSAALITVAGNVYSDEGTTVSGVCDGTTNNITLRVAGLTSYSTSCNATTGAYSIGNVAYSPGDMFVVYIDGESEKGATVSEDPISSVANMHIYEQRVIARHEGTDPLSIADMSVWDSVDDGDIPYTAVTGSPDTLTLPANRKLIVWNSKEFEPVGNVTITGNGGGAAHDGTLELFSGSLFTGGNGESHTIGGSLVSGSGATFDSADSTFTFTANGSGKTIDTNDSDFYNLTMNGSGTWNVNDAILTVSNDLTISSGTLTLPTATTTIGGGLSVTSGSFNANNGTVVFTSGSSENIQAGNSAFAQLRINGSGSFTMLGTNATATRDVLIKSGSLTSVSGTFTIGKEFIVDDTFVHNAGTLRFTATSSVRITASSSDLGTVRTAGVGTYTFTDHDVALLGSLIIQSGTVNLATGTMAIGGSLNNTGGSFTHASGTILFNSTDTGETVQTSGSVFHAIMFGSATGGWTIIENATSTSHVTLSTASSFTLASSTTLTVQGVFTNLVGGAQTTWTGSTLRILSGVPYTINSKTVGGDTYNKVLVGSSTALRMWDSSAAVTMLDSLSSLYAQDYGGVAGALNIYGNYSRSTGADYWSYATDFDGTALGGSSRQVTVYHAAGATTTLSGGSLNIVGAGGNDTTITNQGTGTYTLRVLAGTFNALYYAFSNLGASGLVLSGTPTITSLSEGNFTLAVNNGSLITLASTTLNHNAGLVSSNNSFATTSAITGKNITLVGTTPSSWYFTNHTGNLDGESFDVDGGDACGSVRWSDSSCLLTQQSAYRFRHDDGGEGVPNSEWYDQNWSKRKRVNITNSDPTTYSNTAIKVPVTYDSDMQSDFDDLRFTASDGVTSLDYYIETFSASTNAVAWVRIPSLTANTKTEIYMYYGNGAAIDSSTSTTFSMIENFEDGSMSGYAGDGTGEFSVTTSGNVHERAYSLKASDPNNGRTQNGGVYNSGYAVAQGQKLRYFAYVDTTSGSGDEMCTLFGTQGNDSQNYAVCLELYGTDRISLVENALDNDTSGTILSSTTVSYSTGWYEVEVAWGTDDSIFVTLMKDGSVVATTSANDGTYTSGGIGYSLWFYHGAWDMYTARPLLTNEPSVSFGFEQVSGGASWKSARNTPATGVQINDVVRVRFLVENTGLAVNNQNYEIEYAPKGNAPSCEAVNYNTYVEIPNQASCGTSDLCMQSTTYISNLASTTDILGGLGTYTYGQFVENASNNSGNISVPNNYYTELEYALTPTANVTDSNFCLRVTNEGTELDSYTRVAELELIFAPTITALSLNGGNDIVLTGGATTTVYATGTVSDLNGYDDIKGATTTIFRSGVGESCGANNNNCYVAGNSQCGMQNCSGYTCEVSCSIDMYYHADPTDIGTFAAETWRALLRVNDAGGSVATATAPSIDLLTLRAIAVDSSINYGSLAVNDDTGSYNATTSVQNIGNDSLDIAIEGTDLTDGGSSSIPVNEQKFATSTFTYASCVYCSQLATTTTNIKMDLSKPAATTPAVIDQLFWGIAVPLGVAGTVHQGANTFYAIGDLP